MVNGPGTGDMGIASGTQKILNLYTLVAFPKKLTSIISNLSYKTACMHRVKVGGHLYSRYLHTWYET